jgi:predicted DsbA family dithiol-disulfide isomerase
MDRTRAMIEAAGFPYGPNPDRVPRTRLALELGEAARADGRHGRYHDAVMQAYWSDGRDIGDPAVLRAIGEAVGLTAERLDEALEARAFSAAVDEWTTTAQRSGVNAVPAFVIDWSVLVLGAQPHEALDEAIAYAASRR